MNRQELQKKVRHTVHQLIWENGYASPLDLFLKMEKISSKLIEEWRFGRVPYLERVLHGNLGQLSFIMKEFRKTAREMNLKESYTAYMSWGSITCNKINKYKGRNNYMPTPHAAINPLLISTLTGQPLSSISEKPTASLLPGALTKLIAKFDLWSLREQSTI